MTTHEPPTRTADLTDRYVHATTRRLPEDQRADVAEELHASIGDRVAALRADRADVDETEATRTALVELGDPDVLARQYSEQPAWLVGPDLYPAYLGVLRPLLITAVPVATLVVTALDAADGTGIGAAFGGATWTALTVAVHICFWVTLAFVLVERRGDGAELARSTVGGWTPERLPELPRGPRRSPGELVGDLAWPAILAAGLVWQHLSSPLGDEDRVPLLDPDLWSSWLPLLLALLGAEMVLTVVRHRARPAVGWTLARAAASAASTGVVVYLAATSRLLNPAAVTRIQQDWPAFDPEYLGTVIVVVGLVTLAWELAETWRRERR